MEVLEGGAAGEKTPEQQAMEAITDFCPYLSKGPHLIGFPSPVKIALAELPPQLANLMGAGGAMKGLEGRIEPVMVETPTGPMPKMVLGEVRYPSLIRCLRQQCSLWLEEEGPEGGGGALTSSRPSACLRSPRSWSSSRTSRPCSRACSA